jgi:saccharopine dehydrogenase-like NADP-dependent oxidoreductase
MRDATILLLGGYGETGRRLARHLLERTGARLRLAGRDRTRAEALAAELNRAHPGQRASGLALDAADQAALRRALDGVNLLIVATTAPERPAELAEAALEAGSDWVDLQFAPRQAATLGSLAPRLEAAGRCFVTQGGFHPGIPAALVRWAAARARTLESATVASWLNPRGGIPYTPAVVELVEMFRDYHAHLFRDGRWQRISGWKLSDYPAVDFGPGFGRHRTFPMDLDEMKPLPERIPTLRRTGFLIAGSDPVTNWIVSPLMMAGLGLLPRVRLETWGRLYCWSIRTFARPPYGTLVQLDAEGREDGRRVRLRLALHHEDGYELTAIPVVAMVRQLLDGSARQPGLHLMGLLVEPERLLQDCEAMGVRVERSVERTEAI